MIKKLVLGMGILLIVIQFIRPAYNQSTDSSKDITTVVAVPDDVQKILKSSCYDCHSNYTNYPWYDKIQPVRWWVEHHIKEGKMHLNFSEFANYSIKKQLEKINDLGETIDNDEMPLPAYTIMHKEAKLTVAEKELLINWANETYDMMDASNSESSIEP